jgi:hypothetical protein
VWLTANSQVSLVSKPTAQNTPTNISTRGLPVKKYPKT